MPDNEDDRDSIWQRLDRSRTAPRVQLTHEQIADAAMEIADAEGLDALSMRRLAERLGVSAMGLYRYVNGKSELIELMSDRAFAEAEAPPPGATWRDTLRAMARGLRELFIRHPWLIQTITSVGSPLTPNWLVHTNRLLAAMDDLDADEDAKMAMLTTVGSFVSGFVTAQLRQARLLEQQGVATTDELRHAFASRMRYFLESGSYPAFERYIRGGVRKDDTDWQFEVGLESLLLGLAARLQI